MTTLPTDDARTAALGLGFDGFNLQAVNNDGVTLGYRIAGSGPTVLLVHGWPQSGYEWRQTAADLVQDHRVIVPDSRGAAGSDKPDAGYDKSTMASDLRAVLADANADDAHVVGHDIGLMVAYAFARRYPEITKTLTLIDAFVPGAPMSKMILSSLGPWHFGFHSQVDLATTIVAGRERAYFDFFFDGVSVDPSLITAEDRDFYVAAAQQPGALAAGFKTYAAATTVDSAENEEVLARDGRVTLPVLGIGGSASLGPHGPDARRDRQRCSHRHD